jgi:hypothetical protein
LEKPQQDKLKLDHYDAFGCCVLWCAIGRVTKALQNKLPNSFCFNLGTVTKDGTTVIAQVVVTHSLADTMLLGVSVIGIIGLGPNPEKSTLDDNVNRETHGSRSAHLACVFDKKLGRRERKSVRGTA